MESTLEIEPSDAGSEGDCAKRRAAEDGDALTEKEDSPSPKRSKGSSQRNFGRGEVKKVAEMVMVLAALGKMRGGRGPTEAEKELMAEARYKLAKVCEGFAPSDVFPRDAFGGLIEDLGLNKLNEQRLGFLPPKLSLADKLLVSKRKMEKAEDFSRQSSKDSSQGLLGNSGAAVGIFSASVPVKMSQLSKPTQMSLSISTGHFQSVSPLSHVSTSNSTSLPYQLPSSELRPSVVSSALPTSQLGSSVLQRLDRPYPSVDGRSNGSGHTLQVEANYSANSTVRTATWSFESQTVSAAKIGPDNKVPVTMSLKADGAANVKSGLPSQATSRTVIAQAAGPPLQGNKYVQASVGNVHAEIGKIVQKLLQQVPDHPTWIPPSREYMSKAVTCQLCSSTVTEIDNILICDSCEKGYHLKCLQTSNQKGVSKPEWHCEKCLSLSSGKPLPLKYGKVMRNTNTPNGVLSNLSKMVGDSVEKVGQPKTTIISTPSMQTVHARIEGSNSNHQIPEPKRDVTGVQENGNLSSSSNTDYKIAFETSPNNVMKVPHSASASPVKSSNEKNNEDKIIEIKSIPSAKLENVSYSFLEPEAVVTAKYGNPRPSNDEESQFKQSSENHVVGGGSNESHGDETSIHADQLKEQEVVHDNHSETVGSTGVIIQDRSTFDDLNAVDWVGDPIQVSDDKICYTCCRINGHLYRAMDHVLVHFEKDKLIPSKLQAMWEDMNTKMKWVTINRCYFPDDLPEAVGRPCGLENSEVIESSCGRTLMAGLIESPCEVLPPRKFAEHSKRRSHPGTQLNDGLPPLYLCKWIYDEAKGLFRDVSC